MSSVGVTGHRRLAKIDHLTAGVETALVRIDSEMVRGALSVVSPLAEGADRLVARCVLAHPAARLIVPLPLPREEYLRDFASDESKHEFVKLLERADEVIELPPTPTRDEAYEAAGLYVLNHCDVLIAVWDGNPSQGAGGTAEVVAEARRRKLPIAWVHAGNRKPGTNEPTSFGAEQGTVTFENFPSDAQRRPDARR